METLIEFQNVCKYYPMGDTTVVAADHISFRICKGEFVAIVGSSGSGKSTCMNIIGCLDVPSEGTYLLDGRDVGQMDKNELADIRNELLGFIFQQYNLLPKLNLAENVEVPLMYARVGKRERRERALAALERRHSRQGEIMSLFGIRDRKLSESEQNMVDKWISYGYDNDLIALAYDRTVLRTGGLKWAYLDSILESWKTAGYKTRSEVEQGEGKSAPARQSTASPQPDRKSVV